MGPTPPRQPSTPKNSGSQKRHRGSGQSSPATPTPDLRVTKQRPRRNVTSLDSSRGHDDNNTSGGGHDDGGDGGQRQTDAFARRQENPMTGDTTPPPKSDPAATSAASLAVPGREGNPSCTRPENGRRSVSAPATTRIPQNPASGRSSLDTSIDDIIRWGRKKEIDQAAKGQSSEAKATTAAGSNYILVVERSGASCTYPHGNYKVGSTVRPPNERAKEIQRDCGLVVDLVPGSKLPPIRRYTMVETLMHKELAHFRYQGPFPCGKDHNEFYLVDNVETLLVCQRLWYAFCKSEPWGKDGTLRPRWLERLDAKQEDVAQAVGAGCEEKSIAELWDWDAFVHPTLREKLAADAKTLGEVRLYRRHYATLAVAVAMAVAVGLMLHSFWAGCLYPVFAAVWVFYDAVRPHELWLFACPRRLSV